MKFNRYPLVCLLSAVVFLLVSCKEETAAIGQTAPEIAAFDLHGNKTTLQQWQGKTVLLSFWSETCGVCIQELKTLEQMQQRYPDKIQLVAINIDGEKADTQAVVNKRKIEQFVIKDQLNITAERYGLIGTPTSFLIDPQGKILNKFEGRIPKVQLTALFSAPSSPM